MYKKIINLVQGDSGLTLRFQIRDSTTPANVDILAIENIPETWGIVNLSTATVFIRYKDGGGIVQTISSASTAQEKSLGIVAIPLQNIATNLGRVEAEIVIQEGVDQITIFDKLLFNVREAVA